MTTPAKHDIETPSLWARFKASPIYDPATRAGHSFWQAAVAVLFVGNALPAAGLGAVPWFAGLIAGATAAVGSAALSVASWKVPIQKRPVDLALRLVRTAAVSLAGTWVAAQATVLTFDWQAALLTAALSAAGSLVKTAIVDGGADGKDLVNQRIYLTKNAATVQADVAAMLDRGIDPIQ